MRDPSCFKSKLFAIIVKNDGVLLSSIIALSMYIRLHWLFRGFVFDELATFRYFVDVPSFRVTISTYLEYYNHILYSVLARCAFLCFGRAEWVLRLPALLLSLLSIWFIWYFSKRHYDRRTALLAALALAAAPFFAIWSVTARGYTGQVLFALISTHYFFSLQQKSKPSHYVCYALANTVGLYFHLYFIFIPFVQCIILLGSFIGRHRSGTNLRERFLRCGRIAFAVFSSLLLAFLLYLPVLPQLATNVSRHLHSKLQCSFPYQVLWEFTGRLPVPFSLLLLVLAVIGLRHLYQQNRFHFWYYSVLSVLPIILIMLMRPFYLYPRFVVFLLPFFIILLIIGFVTIYNALSVINQWPGRIVRFALLLTGLGLVSHWLSVSCKVCLTDNFQQVGNYVKGRHYSAEDIYCAIGLGADLFEYYSDRPVIVPESLAELELLAADCDTLRCFYRFRSQTISPAHEQIRLFLEQHAHKERIGSAYVYSYGKKSLMKHRE